MQCQDCFGTGRNKKGGPCKACRGTGRVGKAGATFQAAGALARLVFGIVVIVIVIVAIVSGGGSSSKHFRQSRTPASTAAETPDQIAEKQCELTLAFATARLCKTAFLDAFDLVSLNNGKLDEASLKPLGGLMRRCEDQHHSPTWCGRQLGQAIEIAYRAS